MIAKSSGVAHSSTKNDDEFCLIISGFEGSTERCLFVGRSRPPVIARRLMVIIC